MRYFVKLARSAAEKQAAFELHRRTYLAQFKHDPAAIAETYLRDFYVDTLIVLDQNDQLLGTCSLTFPHENRFPSEVLFGFNLRQAGYLSDADKWIEVGKVAKNHAVKVVGTDLTFLALMLGVTRYCQVNQIEGWLATVQLPLLHRMRAYGMTLSELDSCFPSPHEESAAADLGTYTQNRHIFLIGSDTRQTVLDFQRFQHLIQSGTILMGIGKLALI